MTEIIEFPSGRRLIPKEPSCRHNGGIRLELDCCDEDLFRVIFCDDCGARMFEEEITTYGSPWNDLYDDLTRAEQVTAMYEQVNWHTTVLVAWYANKRKSSKKERRERITTMLVLMQKIEELTR